MKSTSVLAILITLTLTGCGKDCNAMTFEPQSQQHVQDIIVGYLRDTVATLPAGTVIDAGRFARPGQNSLCDDAESGPVAPMRFHTVGELRATGEETSIVAAVGVIWRRWGWHVVEREGFRTPNRFGYSPDGYRLQIVSTGAGHPPVVQASSPCFPRPVANDDVAFPVIITAA